MIDLDLHIGWLVLGGIALLAMTTLPSRFESRPLSLPMVYVAVGFVAFELSDSLYGPRPITIERDSLIIEYVTELIVIMSLASAGLKLDRKMGFVAWGAVWRLLGVTMLVTIAATVALGMWGLGLGLGTAILLGAVIAPTDPVLADDVQVPDPSEEEATEVRFTLTAEAGLNDGLAFPFTHLAILVIGAGGSFTAVAGEWALRDLGYRVAVGALMGWLLGRAMTAFSRVADRDGSATTSEGVFVLGATLLVYGVTEVVNGYGFLAVFVAALSRGDEHFRRRVSDFADEIEQMLLAFVLLGFGALLSQGILDPIGWRGVLIALALVIVVRPVAGLVGFIGSPLRRDERIAISVFGIRGMGSVYYLAYAANHVDIDEASLAMVWAVVSATILVSVVLHGTTGSPLMNRLECGRPIVPGLPDDEGTHEPVSREEPHAEPTQ